MNYMNEGGKLKACKYIILLILSIFIFSFQGCYSSKYSISHGPLKSGEQHATLVIGKHNQPDTVIGIEQIDKNRFGKRYFIKQTNFKLTPGRHTITYYFLMQSGPGTIITSEDFNISFSAEAGHTYTLKNYTQWDNEYPEKFTSADFLTMVTDTTKGEVAAWDSSGTGAFKEEVKSRTGLKFTEETEKKAFKTNAIGQNMGEAAAVCGNDYCEKNENHSNCPADCFHEDIGPTDLSVGDKTVFLDFVYKGQKSGIYFVVNRGVHEKLASLPRWLSYQKGQEKFTKKDFIIPKLDNQLQKEKLLPLVAKIESLTPDVSKQARIAISLVQNIPYGFQNVSYSEADYIEKYPYGVIWEQMGVCGEKSDLLLFLLRELGFGTATFIFKKEDHRTVGIKCPDAYDFGNSGYCFVEVTSPKIITDNLSTYTGVGTLTDFEVIGISDGIQLEGVEEEFADKNSYYDLINKAKSKNGALDQDEYTLYNSILNKYGISVE